MKRILTALSLLVFLVSSHVATGQNHKVFSEADYQQAVAMLGGNVSKYVDNTTNGEQTPWLSRKELFGDLPLAVVE